MPNYKDGKIYKLCSLVSDKIYVGSTCQPLCKRLGDHKKSSKREPDRIVYKHINQIGWNNYKIILIENSPCNNKEELERKERYYIEMLHSELNYNIPTRTDKEYRETHKQQKSEHSRKYRERNKERIRFKDSIYYLKCKFKKLIIDCNDTSKEYDELITKFNLIH